MEWSTASARGVGLSLQLRVNKSTGPVGDCCVGWWVQGTNVELCYPPTAVVQPLADNTILHLSEFEQRRVVLLVVHVP